MRPIVWWLLTCVVFYPCVTAAGEPFPKVDSDLADYDAKVAKMNEEFAKLPGDATSKDWVQAKLKHMFEIDQYMRKFSMSVPSDHQYSEAEQKYFGEQFMPRWLQLDEQNAKDLKELLKVHSWFTISQWGKAADNRAWLIVQHADHDPEFQREVLAKLEKLYAAGETRPSNYAYLFDRVACSFHDVSKRQLQRYGTQGRCTGPGKWEPFPIEDEPNVDVRRAEVGLPPLHEYIAGFQDICK